jgi:outer membrane protein TolC
LEETLYNWNVVGSELYKKMSREFTPAKNWKKLPQNPELSEDLLINYQAQTLNNIRPLKILDKTIAQLNLDIEANRRQAMPNMSVYGEVSDYKNEDSATDSFSNLNSRDTVVGLEFSYSLDKSDTKGGKIQLNETIRKIEETRANTKASLANLLNNNILKDNTWQKIESNSKRLSNYSKEKLFLESKRFKNGKSYLRDVSDYRNQYANNKTAHLNKVIQLAKLKVTIASLNDELLEQVENKLKEEK